MIYLVRHGQTDWNKRRVFNGVTETDLNQTGIMQSEELREDMLDKSIDICFSSPQKRAVQSSEIIFDGEIILDDRLTEIVCGEFEGTDETKESIENFWEASKNGDKGIEEFSLFVARTCNFCDMVVEEYKNKNVLIVTHAANARVINYYFSGKPKDYDFHKSVSRSGGVIAYQN